MGIVYEACHRTLGRRVAVKVLHARAAASQVQMSRFLGEGRAAAQVRHPHVVDVFDFGVDDGVPYLVMELVEGETLALRLAREGALSLTTVAELLLPVVSAVAELHAAGIIHRDLKPANILLANERSAGSCPKVADFGVSRMSDSLELTDSRAVVGTFAYMAPEQGRSSRAATEQSDLYTLGVILYECAVGARPFAATTPYELLDAIMNEPLVAPSSRRPGIPREFDAMVLRAMSRDPAARFACADELGEALLAFAAPRIAERWRGEFQAPQSKNPMESVPPVASSRRVAAARRRRRPRVGLLAATLLGGLIVASVVAKHPWSSNQSPAPAASPLPPASDVTPLPAIPLPLAPPPPAIQAPAFAPTAPMWPSPPPASARPRPVPARPVPPPAKVTDPGALDNGAPILEP
jgi:serine/threonine-protein kinase